MPISKTAQLLRYFAQQYGAPGIPRLRLVKLAYMSDVLGREYLGCPITDFAYYRYTNGPYDDAVIVAIKELVDAGLATNGSEWNEGGVTRRLKSTGVPIAFEFSVAEMEILKYVTDAYLRMDISEFVEQVVYLTPPMVELLTARPKDKKPLNMGQLDHAGTKQVGGFHLEAILRAEDAIRAGQFVTTL